MDYSLMKKLKAYKEKEEVEVDYEIEEEKLRQIKVNFLLFSKEYIKLFNEFRKYFSDCVHAKGILDKHGKHSLYLNNLIFEYEKDISIGQNALLKSLQDYINKNYYEMLDFVDMALGVYSE